MIHSEVIAIEQVSQSDIDELFTLFCSAFSASREGFVADLGEKDYLLRLRNDGHLQAFSTLKVLSPEPGVRLIYSGDTYASEKARLGHRLPAQWAQFVFHQLPRSPDKTDYWLLLCSGFRTYRILATFFHHYEPALKSEPDLRERLDRWAGDLFGERYQSGVVRPLWPTPLLAPEPPTRLLQDSQVQFFESVNPDYRRGAELACLIPLEFANLRPSGQRLVGPDQR